MKLNELERRRLQRLRRIWTRVWSIAAFLLAALLLLGAIAGITDQKYSMAVTNTIGTCLMVAAGVWLWKRAKKFPDRDPQSRD